ncbi:hypothetical protein [Microbulbifer aestuariivivens]|uniref:hypothetical protein n=1 Tax=Microbulbifer aestuariivivens TaxID=1908308 RepID=UPI0031EF8B9C
MDFDIEVELDGKVYEGSYISGGNMVTVFFEGESRSTQIDGAAGNIEALGKL